MTPIDHPLRLAEPSLHRLRLNTEELVTIAVGARVAHPVAPANPYRIGHDGVPRVLAGPGGIVLSHRIGDACVGLVADHLEAGVALHNNAREVVGPRNGPNNALLTYACVGNLVEVTSGACRGARGMVTGKHGGVDHVIVDFPPRTLRALAPGDAVKVCARGLGLRLIDVPDVSLFNCSPALLRRWGLVARDGTLVVPVARVIPARVMGSGLGRNTVWRGDYDIQLFDAPTRRRYGLDALRFGDMVAILDADARHGPSFHGGWTTIGTIVHGDSTVSGHGPGVTVLMTGRRGRISVTRDRHANLAAIFGLRRPTFLRGSQPLAHRDPTAHRSPRRANFDTGGEWSEEHYR